MTVPLLSALLATSESLADWQPSDIEQGLAYVELGALASTVSELDASGAHDWSRLFAEVERRLATEPAARNLLVLGFLESLQNIELNRGRPLARWEPLLGPETRVAWRAVIDFWAGRLSRDAAVHAFGAE